MSVDQAAHLIAAVQFAAFAADIVDVTDVWMIEGRGCPRLVQQPAP